MKKIHFVFTTVNMKCPWVADVTLDWKAEMVITHLKLKTHASQAQEPKPAELLMPVDALFAQHPALIVTLGQTEKLKHGAAIRDWHFADGTYRVYSETGEFLLLGTVKGQILTTVKSFFDV